jgi:hypothetical protein
MCGSSTEPVDLPRAATALMLQNVTPSEWQDALLSEPGERQFVTGEGDFTRLRSVLITGQARCADRTGCPCEGHPELRAAVCTHTRDRNGDCHDLSNTACLSPVQPLGHCCAFCGQYDAASTTNGDPVIKPCGLAKRYPVTIGRFCLFPG